MLGKVQKSILASMLAASAIFAAPKPLTVWIMPNGASPQEKLEQRLEIFTKQTGIPTQVQVLDWGEAWNRISQALAGEQDSPDVLQLGTTWIPYFASRGELRSLNTWKNEIDPDRYVPVSWETTHIDGDTLIYSLPWFIDIRPVLANKRIFKENGLTKESVATYEGFVEAVRKVNDAKSTLDDGTRIRGYAFPGKSDWNIPHNFAPWIWSNGGSFIEKDVNGKWRSNILTKESLQGIARYLNFIRNGLVSPEALESNTAQIAQQFNNGELAFIVNTSEIVMQTRYEGAIGGLSNARIGSDSVMVLPIPRGNAGSISFIGGSNLAIPAKNDRKEAKDLLMFLVSDDNLDAYTKQIGFLPTSKRVLETWSQDDDYRELVKALETGRTYKAIPEWGELEQLLVSMFSSIWEQIEIPSLYSEKKLYEIFMQYTLEIDKKLNYPVTSKMTEAEFTEIWEKVSAQPAEEAKAAPQDERQNILNDNLTKAPLVFLVMVILGFVFNFKRKSKK